MPKRKGSSRRERTTEIGKYLTWRRLRLRRTQQEIAAKIGRDKSYICKIETGQRERKSAPQKSLRGFILYQLAEAYEAPIAEILEKANWTQLLLLDTNEEERQQLIQHLKKIRREKHK